MVKGNARGSRKKRKGGRRTKGWRLDPLEKKAAAKLDPHADVDILTNFKDGHDQDMEIQLPEVKPLWAIRLWRWIKSRFVK